MIRAHAARTDATKWKIVLHVVHQRVVDRDVARRRAAENRSAIAAVSCAEVVERQGPRSRIDIGDGFLNLAVGEDRQDWSEDFLTHYRHVVCRIEYDRRGQRVGTRGRIFAVRSEERGVGQEGVSTGKSGW